MASFDSVVSTGLVVVARVVGGAVVVGGVVTATRKNQVKGRWVEGARQVGEGGGMRHGGALFHVHKVVIYWQPNSPLPQYLMKRPLLTPSSLLIGVKMIGCGLK